jgi:hypothetical protein
MFKTLLLAASVAATALITAPAQSQVRVETRIERSDDEPRYRERRGYEERRGGYERRIVRSRFRDDCRMVEKRRVNRFGEVVISRSRICR